ncbi:MAG: hypothetical protein N4A49_14630 [Marinifilaceae bacterium]|jgi:hypothetical protein|nr:hypothetical protein [Marinifilaceae bacterium]
MYNILFQIEIFHSYFKDNICTSFELLLSKHTKEIFEYYDIVVSRDRLKENLWTFLINSESKNTERIGLWFNEDNKKEDFEIFFRLRDRAILKYTVLPNYDPMGFYKIRDRKSNISEKQGIIHHNINLSEARQARIVMHDKFAPHEYFAMLPIKINSDILLTYISGERHKYIFNFELKEVYWRYVIILRDENDEPFINFEIADSKLEYEFHPSEQIETIEPYFRSYEILSKHPIAIRRHYLNKLELWGERFGNKYRLISKLGIPFSGSVSGTVDDKAVLTKYIYI